MRRFVVISLWMACAAAAQTTQGMLAGRVVDSETGAAVAGARIACGAFSAPSDAGGYYAIPLLPPGMYRARAAADGYQAREVFGVEIAVAGRVDLDFRLRRLSDVWETGQYRSIFLPGSRAVVNFYGPDVDASRSEFVEAPRSTAGTLAAAVSYVVDPVEVRDLPLAGRDIYTMLVMLPGVTADAATARGLGLSVNGGRPTASNFLLDGAENNNYLVTGPLTAIAPEAVQEYRVSTNNYAAEYGRTAGILANAVTRAGGSAWHGTGYWYQKNDWLNANGFQENRLGLPRPPLKEWQPGVHAGGPLRRNTLAVSTAFERLRSRGRGDPVDYQLPTARLLDLTAPNSVARRLLQGFPAPAAASGDQLTATWRTQPPASLDRWLALERADWTRGIHRVFARAALARVSRPDFVWSPYRDFVSGLREDTYSVAAGIQSAPRPHLTNEARASWNTDTLAWGRAHPEIPTLVSGDGTYLPGSPAFYAYRNRSRGWELLDNLIRVEGRHILKTGGGVLLRGLDGYLTAGRDAFYGFRDIVDFTLDRPLLYSAAVSRQAGARMTSADYNRQYRQTQFFAFAQDSFRASRRLTFDYGVRYESFGAPRNTGPVQDPYVELGPGAGFAERLASARLVWPSGSQSLYQPDRRDWAGRFGFSADPDGRARTVLRGAYGIFYDRPFDNLWQGLRNNGVMLTSVFVDRFPVDYLSGAAPPGTAVATALIHLDAFQPDLPSAYAQNWFLGVQHRAAENWLFEVNGQGSLGRKLITTDLVNRPPYNAALGTIAWRGSQGSSNYNALAASARYRSRRAQFQAAYTWSHSIDNQSDPLAGDFFDLSFARVTTGGGSATTASFAREFDSRADRGNSDFDQRHNLLFFSIWDLPRGWKFAQMAAFRSGFPYSVLAPGGGRIVNNRADLVDPARASASLGAAGGVQLLDPAAFRTPAAGTLGNLGRNSFSGPGLYNIDLSLSRSFALPRLGESGRLSVRLDAFNFLNHANLNQPQALVGSSDFGVALYGRKGRDTGFPALVPFTETGRQLQVLLRIEF